MTEEDYENIVCLIFNVGLFLMDNLKFFKQYKRLSDFYFRLYSSIIHFLTNKIFNLWSNITVYLFTKYGIIFLRFSTKQRLGVDKNLKENSCIKSVLFFHVFGIKISSILLFYGIVYGPAWFFSLLSTFTTVHIECPYQCVCCLLANL